MKLAREMRGVLDLLLGLRRHEDGLHGLTKVKAHPAVFGLANLFLCGYFDSLIRYEDGEYYLSIFIAITAAFCSIFFLGLFLRRTDEVLEKSTVLPVPKAARFLYAWFATARRPLFLAMYLTDMMFFIVLYRSLTPVILLGLLILNIQLLISALLIRDAGSAAGGAILAGIVLLLGGLGASTLFHVGIFAHGTPVLGWVTNGILASQQHEWGTVITVEAGLIISAAVLSTIGIRRARA